MPEKSPESARRIRSCSEAKPSGAQEKTPIFAPYRESIIGNPLFGVLALLVASTATPARPTGGLQPTLTS
jgi:hypothetical protein